MINGKTNNCPKKYEENPMEIFMRKFALHICGKQHCDFNDIDDAHRPGKHYTLVRCHTLTLNDKTDEKRCVVCAPTHGTQDKRDNNKKI